MSKLTASRPPKYPSGHLDICPGGRLATQDIKLRASSVHVHVCSVVSPESEGQVHTWLLLTYILQQANYSSLLSVCGEQSAQYT